ncbi:MAG: 16S rRNA (cytosine(1402)-N(4))-methyltransferase RsmH [Chthoniobacterales bacterium]
MSSLDSASRHSHAGPDAVWHEPVLRNEVLRVLEPRPGKIFLDGTLGGGGHSESLLAAGARVVGLDRDKEALQHAGARLSAFGDRFRAVHANFSEAADNDIVRSFAPFDGALLDIGVSSRQLDSAERGFSFRHDGPLDMRMDSSAGETAADLLNTAPEEELARIFREFGEEPQSRRAARAIAAERERIAFARTGQLAALIEKVIPRRGRIHPAMRKAWKTRVAG